MDTSKGGWGIGLVADGWMPGMHGWMGWVNMWVGRLMNQWTSALRVSQMTPTVCYSRVQESAVHKELYARCKTEFLIASVLSSVLKRIWMTLHSRSVVPTNRPTARLVSCSPLHVECSRTSRPNFWDTVQVSWCCYCHLYVYCLLINAVLGGPIKPAS